MPRLRQVPRAEAHPTALTLYMMLLDGGRTDGVFDSMYDMHAVMCRALRLEFDDVDERVVEVLGPSSVDVMAAVDSTK